LRDRAETTVVLGFSLENTLLLCYLENRKKKGLSFHILSDFSGGAQRAPGKEDESRGKTNLNKENVY